MTKQIQEMVCITCPLSCRIELEIENGELVAVQHNSCKRGIDYARQEFYDPRRMVTTTAFVSGGSLKRVPVCTSEPIPMKQIDALLKEIYRLQLEAPLELGQTVIKNFADTGIDVIATRNLH
jgi:CxxC motif-containing protein